MSSPFLRWAGGKRWLSGGLAPLISQALEGAYHEPFLGGGAMFFGVAPERAHLSDLNAELINAYVHVARDHRSLAAALQKLPSDATTYYKVRSIKAGTDFERAVRFLYLNRNCYGGIYRENQKGEFNVPYGGGSRDHSPLWEKGLLRDAEAVLSKTLIELTCCSYQEAFAKLSPGDIIYCDPTYRAVTRTQFDRYGAQIFDWHDQLALASLATKAYENGITVLISNAFCKEIFSLYPHALPFALRRSKSFGSHASKSARNLELLFVLDPYERTAHWNRLIKMPGFSRFTISAIERARKSGQIDGLHLFS